MLRLVCVVTVVIALGGCGKREESADQASFAAGSAPAPAPDRMMAGNAEAKRSQSEGPKLAYSHNLSIETKADTVKQRFEQVRDACVSGAVPGCVLLNARIAETPAGFRQASHPVASLSVRLSHEGVAPFEQAVLKPLPGEQASDLAVISRSTSAEDLTAAIQDGDRRLAQLTDYRDRLTLLAKRADAKVDDLIKVQSELSTTQSQIEELTAEQKRLGQRVDTELETVEITGKVAVGRGSDIAEVWHRSAQILDSAVADSLQFLISAVPWIVTFLVVMVLLPIVRVVVRVLWRLGRPRI